MKTNAIKKEKYQKINNYYNIFIIVSLIIFILLGMLALINPHFFPRPLSFTAISVTILSTIGLMIDKREWKRKLLIN